MTIKSFTDAMFNEYIHVYKNVFSTNECEEIIDEFEDDNWSDCGTYGNNSHDARTAKYITISGPLVIQKNYDKRKKLDNLVNKKVHKCIEKYCKTYKHLNIDADTGYDLLKYEKNAKHIEHVDMLPGPILNKDNTVQSISLNPRQVSCSILLNKNFYGGELVFNNNEYKIDQELGSVILFPSNFLFPHQVTPVAEGVRYCIVTWFIKKTL